MGRHGIHRNPRDAPSRQTRAVQPPHRHRRSIRGKALQPRRLLSRTRRLRRAPSDAPGRCHRPHRHVRARQGGQMRRLSRRAVRRKRRRVGRSVRERRNALRRPHGRARMDAIHHRRPRRHRACHRRDDRAVRGVRQRARRRRLLRRGGRVAKAIPGCKGAVCEVVPHKGFRRLQRRDTGHRVETRGGHTGANELL